MSSTTTCPAPTTRWFRSPWFAVAVLTVPLFMAAIDMTVLFLAVPEIASTLETGPTQQLWVLHVGDLVGAGLVLTAGTLAGRLGPRRLLAVGIALYGAASLLAAFAPTADVLILARGVLGAAGVTIMPAAIGILRQMVPDEIGFARAVGLLMASFSAGMAAGPPLGGLLLDTFWWGAVFLVNVPVAVLVLALIPLLAAPEARTEGRLDLSSVLLSLAGVAALVFALQELAASGLDPLLVGVAVLGAVGVVLFVLRQRRIDHPILPLGLFASRRLRYALAVVGLTIVADSAAIMQLAQHLQVVSGLSATGAGGVLALAAGAAFVSTALAPHLLRWVSAGALIGGGALLAVAGSALLVVTVQDPAHALWPVVLGVVVLELGLGPVFGVGSGLVISSAPEEQSGPATALQDVAGSLGNVVSLAAGGLLALLVFRATVAAQELPGVSGDDADSAQEGVGAALALVDRLDGGAQVAVADAVQTSMAAATASLYAAAAVGLLVVAALAWHGLRDRPAGRA